MSQEHAKKSKQTKKTEAAPEETVADVRTPGLDDDIDSILADIDDVLEENAQDFVNAFVQKGGQ